MRTRRAFGERTRRGMMDAAMGRSLRPCQIAHLVAEQRQRNPAEVGLAARQRLGRVQGARLPHAVDGGVHNGTGDRS